MFEKESLILSRPYLSNGRAIGSVVVRPSVRLSVTDVGYCG